MGPLTSVRKIWELCVCHVSRAPQPASIPGDLRARGQGEGDWWPVRSHPRHDAHAETLAGAAAPALIAIQRTHLRSEVAGCHAPGWGVLSGR